MSAPPPVRTRLSTGLSARLLILTVLFVMLSEVLIYVPSIARFRRDYLENSIAKAHLAVLALEATPDNMVSRELQMALLSHADAYAIVVTDAHQRMLVLGEPAPPSVDARIDLREEGVWDWISQAFATLSQTANRVLAVTGSSPAEPGTAVEVIVDETPLRDAMRAFSIRILTLSIIISLVTAGLVFFSLQWLMVRPIVQLTDAMMRIRERPEDTTAVLRPTSRTDEIGVAQRELAVMQAQIRASLRQKSRLAAIGAAMAKINHDLRNALSTATLASDRLSAIADPEVQRVAPALYGAIDRASTLCTRTLDFVSEVEPNLRIASFRLGELVAEVETGLADGAGKPVAVACRERDLVLEGDRDHFLRVLANLAANAAQAGARKIEIEATALGNRLIIELRDDGSGIPPAQRDTLFIPFSTSGRNGGTGLGLAIAREIVRAHGGELSLAATGPAGTTFRIDMPRSHLAGRRVATAMPDIVAAQQNDLRGTGEREKYTRAAGPHAGARNDNGQETKS
ncbi:MAG: HAMP domain-containing histidine kinase [Rhodospirillales bacterium]|nr:HAMP domain-containing histidine kinase [Rhodospirillales bacterium]